MADDRNTVHKAVRFHLGLVEGPPTQTLTFDTNSNQPSVIDISKPTGLTFGGTKKQEDVCDTVVRRFTTLRPNDFAQCLVYWLLTDEILFVERKETPLTKSRTDVSGPDTSVRVDVRAPT